VKKLLGMMALAAATALTACGGKQVTNNAGPTFAGGPDWVNKGSGAFGGEKGRVFYGVGIASGIRNASMRRSTSDLRARAEIAKTLDTYVSALNKAYQASTTAGDMSASSEEQHVSEALKGFTQMQLSGAQIVDHWIAADGTEFSLAQLDLAGMKDNMDKMKELNAKVRDAVRANADKAFDELAAEEAKAGARR
jgi:hypothetical protein